MSVKAKFKVERFEITQYKRKIDEKGPWQGDNVETLEMRTIIMNPVYGNGDPEHENTQFWKASPSGELRLGCVNKEVWPQFELGKEYYLTFEKAE